MLKKVKRILKTIWKSKTLLFSVLLAVFGVVELNLSVFSRYLSEEMFGWFTIVVGAIVAVLRVVTTGSVIKDNVDNPDQ